MNKDIIRQLKQIKKSGQINPDRVWVEQNKKNVLSQVRTNQIRTNIESTTEKASQFARALEVFRAYIPVNNFARAVVRPLLIFLIVGAVAASSWIASVSATQNCLPGEICYGVKMAAEKTKALVVSVAGSEKSKTQLDLEYASRRVKEVKKVVGKKEENSAKNASVAIKHLQKSIESAGEGLESVGEKEPEEMVGLVKDLNKAVDEIVETLKEVGEEAPDAGLGKEVMNVKKVVNDVGLDAVEVVLEKQAEGAVEMTEGEAKILVEEKIAGILDDAKETKEGAVEVGDISGELSEEILASVSSTAALATSSLPLAVSPSPEEASSSTIIKKVVEEAAEKADESSEEVEKVMEEAKDLLDSNQLLEAIQKVKQGSDINKKAEEVVSDAKVVIEEALLREETNEENSAEEKEEDAKEEGRVKSADADHAAGEETGRAEENLE